MTHKLTAAIQPWYRHRWPWLLMSGPFIVVVAGFVTAYIAFSSNDGLVDDDYYKQGLAVNQITAREKSALRLGFQAEVMQAPDGDRVRVLLRANAGTALPDSLRMRIAHPTRAGVDQNLLLRSESSGVYAGRLESSVKGRWHVSLEDEKKEWRLTGDWLPEKNAVLKMPLQAAGEK